MASGTVSTTLSEWLVVVLLVFSLVFEAVLHHVERWITTRHAHLQPALKIVYRELMVLGLISFIFIMYQQVANPKGSVILSFEFAHVFIFLLAIFYTLVVLFSLYTSLRLSARWKRMESISLTSYVAEKDAYKDLRLRMHAHRSPVWRTLRWWWPDVRTLLRHRYLHELIAFHDIRFQFIFYRRLPDTFRFSSFLRKVKSHVFIRLVESHWSLYALFLLGLLVDLARRYAFGLAEISNKLLVVRATESDDSKDSFETDIVEVAFIMAAALFLMLFVQVLALKIRNIYWILTKNPRLYYQDVDLATTTAAAADDDDSTDNPSSYPADPSATPSQRQSSQLPAPKQALPTTPLRLQNPDAASPILNHSSRPSSSSGDRDRDRDRTGSHVANSDAFDTLEKAKPRTPSRTVRIAGPAAVHAPDASVDDVPELDIERGFGAPPPGQSGTSSSQPSLRDQPDGGLGEFMRHKSLAVTSATMQKHLEDRETAKKEQARTYPWIVRKVIPRLNRVASPAEKLFWFGSHNFFFWCIEFTLFFSTVLVSSSLAGVCLLLFEGNPVIHVNIAALVLSLVALVFVLVRTAGILKKYAFVLLNASLIPEEIAVEAIENVKNKHHRESKDSSEAMELEAEAVESVDEQVENETHASSALQRRQTITQFMKTELEGVGNNAAEDLGSVRLRQRRT